VGKKNKSAIREEVSVTKHWCRGGVELKEKKRERSVRQVNHAQGGDKTRTWGQDLRAPQVRHRRAISGSSVGDTEVVGRRKERAQDPDNMGGTLVSNGREPCEAEEIHGRLSGYRLGESVARLWKKEGHERKKEETAQ